MSNKTLTPKPSSKVTELVEMLANKIKDMDHGTVLAHLYLANEIGVPYRDGGNTNNNYFSWVNKLKSKLVDDFGVFLTSVSGVGYKIVLPGEEYEVCKKQISTGIRRVRKGAAEAQKIRIDRIEDEQQRSHTLLQIQKFANLAGLYNQKQLETGNL